MMDTSISKVSNCDDLLTETIDFRKILDFSYQLPKDTSNFYQECILKLSEFFQYNKIAFHEIDKNGYFCNGVTLNISDDALRFYYDNYRTQDFFCLANSERYIKNNKRVYTIPDFMSYPDYEKTALCKCLQCIEEYHEAVLLFFNQNRPIAVLVLYHNKSHPGFSSNENWLKVG